MHQINGTELVTKRVTKNRFRRSIIDAWDGCCAYCGDRPDKITLDHVVPKIKGGTTSMQNLVPACARCNVKKNHCDVWEWFQAQPWHEAIREARLRSWVQGEWP